MNKNTRQKPEQEEHEGRCRMENTKSRRRATRACTSGPNGLYRFSTPCETDNASRIVTAVGVERDGIGDQRTCGRSGGTGRRGPGDLMDETEVRTFLVTPADPPVERHSTHAHRRPRSFFFSRTRIDASPICNAHRAGGTSPSSRPRRRLARRATHRTNGGPDIIICWSGLSARHTAHGRRHLAHRTLDTRRHGGEGRGLITQTGARRRRVRGDAVRRGHRPRRRTDVVARFLG